MTAVVEEHRRATGASQAAATAPVVSRLAAIDWPGLEMHLDAHGWAMLDGMLSPDECRMLAGLYDAESGFRSHVVMARHGFGRGEYRYFSYPLPPLRQGDAVVFAVSHRPVTGTRGSYRVNLRHGVSRIRSGDRHTPGVIFHDAT